jgi:hypothetical protein
MGEIHAEYGWSCSYHASRKKYNERIESMVSNWTTCGKLQDAYQEWGFSTIINRAKSAPEVILGKWFCCKFDCSISLLSLPSLLSSSQRR